MNEKIELRAVSAPWHGGIDLLLRQGNMYGVNITMETKEGDCIIEPTIRIDVGAGQLLMDDLWNSGIRPTEGTGSAGSLKATEKHLYDMRMITFKCLKIDN